jgi:hypothetical protein
MRKLLNLLFALAIVALPLVACASQAHGGETGIKQAELDADGTPSEKKISLGSITGFRLAHDKIYPKGTPRSDGYKCKSINRLSGLTTNVSVRDIAIDLTVGYGYDSYKYERNTGPLTAHASYHGYSLYGIADVRYCGLAAFKAVEISPIVGLSCERIHRESFMEKYAGNSNRDYEKDNLKILKARLGALLERDFYINSHKCKSYLKLLYSRALNSSEANVHFVENGKSVTERSNFQKKNGFELTIGVRSSIFSKIGLDLNYELFTSRKMTSHAGIVILTYNF